MEIYYQNETLYVDIIYNLTDSDYRRWKKKIFRIIEDYGVDKIIIKNHHQMFHNRQYLRQMKQDYYEKYKGDLYIR